MFNTHDAITVAVKTCASCGGGLFEYDKFCRWCGARQLDFSASDKLSGAPSTNLASPYTTSALDQSGRLLNRVSGPLVSAVIAGVSASSPDAQSQFVKRAILALISVPIWLIIVLLSPLDAYAAAKNLLR
ncbi:MAG: hypothetical protein WBV94_27490 [Blastocatellia bacterium]